MGARRLLFDEVGYNRERLRIEENVKIGGFGSLVVNFYKENGLNTNVNVLAVNDEFVSHATIDKQLELNGFTVENVIKLLK